MAPALYGSNIFITTAEKIFLNSLDYPPSHTIFSQIFCSVENLDCFHVLLFKYSLIIYYLTAILYKHIVHEHRTQTEDILLCLSITIVTYYVQTFN